MMPSKSAGGSPLTVLYVCPRMPYQPESGGSTRVLNTHDGHACNEFTLVGRFNR
jgi:hypothetical protein